MRYETTALERAFALAKSGTYKSVDEIKLRLKAEGYSLASITGQSLKKQLQALIVSAQSGPADI